jgi:hypothetical protein
MQSEAKSLRKINLFCAAVVGASLSQKEEPKRAFAEGTLNVASTGRLRVGASSPKRRVVVDQRKIHLGDQRAWGAALDAKQAVTRQFGGVTGDVVSKASSGA